MATHAQTTGLCFHSHSYSTDKRTRLTLCNGGDISTGNIFELSFLMDLRDEPAFGNIFCIKTTDGHHIDGICSAQDDNTSCPALVVDGKIYPVKQILSPGKNISVKLTISRKEGSIRLEYNKANTTVKADLHASTSVHVLFGMHKDESNYVDVAPINVRDIRISSNGKEKHHWALADHEGPDCKDSHSKMMAAAENGEWIYDNHVIWKKVYSMQSTVPMQVAFNEADNIFYLLDQEKVYCLNPETKKITELTVKGGYRVMPVANYLVYDSKRSRLLNYELDTRKCSHFNFQTQMWSCEEEVKAEPKHSNHAWAQLNDSIAYTFGGYGYYRYHNTLSRINLNTLKVEKVDYSPQVSPRTGCAAGIAGDKLYIFGGYGNESGQQELQAYYLYDLVCIDLKTMKANTLWVGKGKQDTSFQLASEMIYDEKSNVFYAATTNMGGRIISISPEKPGWQIMTDEINENFEFKEMNFNLYKSTKENKLYVVMNKSMNDMVHNVIICSIDLPLQSDYVADISRWQDDEPQAGSSWWWIIVAALLATAVAGGGIIYKRKRKIATKATVSSENTEKVLQPQPKTLETDKETVETEIAAQKETADSPETETTSEVTKPAELKKVTTGGYITLLGKFSVTDKDGEDITTSFSKRLRDLLLIILLNTQKNAKGIDMTEIDENLWQNMSEVSARNNRNVNISKLRTLLEKVGNVKIVNDKINYSIQIGKDVKCDYIDALRCMHKINEGYTDQRLISKTLSLLLKGPLVPNVSYEWLDTFKAHYSESALKGLNRLLKVSLQEGAEENALKIAETIMMHDPFNDNALAVQCRIHSENNRKGIAKKVYDNFCRTYEASMGESYDKTFSELLEMK